MGKKSRRKKSKVISNKLISQQMDLPLANFSESPHQTFREPKISTVALMNVGKSSSVLEKSDDFNDDDDDVPEDWIERDEDEILSISKSKVKVSCSDAKEGHGHLIQSHTDFWHLLSRYIAPSDVGKFALICKTSYYTVASQGFWRRLYRRHYDPVLHFDLPERFQPDCMSRPRGLRAEVIKMLHQTDQQLLERQSRESSIWPDPHLLTGRTCSLQTSHRIGKRSIFHYFKLTEVPRTKLLSVNRPEDSYEDDLDVEEIGDKRKTRKLLADLSDIYYNPEEGSKVLQVSAASWSSIPPVMGQKLLSVSLSVSHGMRYHKLKLIFGSPLATASSLVDQESSQVISELQPFLVSSQPCRSSLTAWWVSRYLTGGTLSTRGWRSLSLWTVTVWTCLDCDITRQLQTVIGFNKIPRAHNMSCRNLHSYLQSRSHDHFYIALR